MKNEDSNKQRLRKVMCEVFDYMEAELPENPDQVSIDKWDSLEHLRLIMAAENEFGIKFRTERIPHLTSLELLLLEIEKAHA